MSDLDSKSIIAKRIAEEIMEGDVVNLGIGLPEMVADYIPGDKHVFLQSENGIIGMGRLAKADEIDKNIINAGNKYVIVEKGACFFDSATSFGIIGGGHVDVTVLGVLEIDKNGSFASHKIPGKLVPGMGGAMDLVSGAKKVIIATTHNKKNGNSTIVEKLTLPATAFEKAHLIITELAVMRVTKEGLVVEEIADGITVDELQVRTGAKLIVSDQLKLFEM